MNNSYEILIENVKEAMQQKGWSQSKLGEEAGVSQERISNLLNGKTQPTLYFLDCLADALHVSSVQLLTKGAIVAESQSSYTVKEIIFTKYGKTSKVKNITISIPNWDAFKKAFITFNEDPTNISSGKPRSYTNYMSYLFQNYYDNFGEVLDPFDKQTANKLKKLQQSKNFKAYNLQEARFPNAALQSYYRFQQQND